MVHLSNRYPQILQTLTVQQSNLMKAWQKFWQFSYFYSRYLSTPLQNRHRLR
ncbi:MAG: hypothetical protein MUF72_07470 [Elainella sp. Prado103]|jgi:hypothetical protein|nr:hypothetical protein [Elainella sp. Prado103]